MQLAIDAFGPISDNAGGVAEMSGQKPIVRERTDILDSVGNTTAATGKGFAIASAALTSLALFAAYVTFTGIEGINIFKAPVLAMLFIGGMVPVVFSALAMNAVGKAAMEMVYEVRRQFKEIPGIMKGKAKPEYDKCVDISTKASLKEMMLPGILAIGTPVLITLIPMLVGIENQEVAEMLGGYMAGVTVSGVLWAIFQNNAGGAWDNAKKSFEAGVEINGEMTYKGSEAHKASVTGDTVGDPFKDTSGPSMNILIKLTCLIGLVIAPILGGHGAHDTNEISESYIYDATYLDNFEIGDKNKVVIVQSMVRDVIAKDYEKFADYLADDVVFNLSDGSSLSGKESVIKHVKESYSQVEIKDYNVAVNLAVTGDNGDEWVLLWDNGKVVSDNGDVSSLNWMESFMFDGDKISFINQFSKSRN